MDVLDISNDEGSFKPICEWPGGWRQFIAGMDIAVLAVKAFILTHLQQATCSI